MRRRQRLQNDWIDTLPIPPSPSAEFMEMLGEKSEDYDLIFYFLRRLDGENFSILGSGANKLYLAASTLVFLRHPTQSQSMADTDLLPTL